jgi:hypothetical protein
MASYMDLLQLDLPKLPDTLLTAVTQLSLAKGASRLLFELAHEIISRGPERSKNAGMSVAYSALLELDPDMHAKLSYVDKLIDLSAEGKRPVGRLILLKANLLNELGQDTKEFMIQSTRKYQDDPELIAFFQQFQMMNNRGMAGGDLGSRMVATAGERQAAKEEGSSLILPGQSEPSSQGESKLWLPGT